MDYLILITIIFYMLSTAGYIAYLFAQKDYLQRTAYYLLAVGFLLHTAAMAYGFVQSGHIPVGNLFETLSMAAWTVAGVFLVLQYKFKLKVLGIYAAPLVTLVMAIASQLPREPVQVTNIYKSFWLVIHVIAIFIGEASFALACGVGLFLLGGLMIKLFRSLGFVTGVLYLRPVSFKYIE